MAYSYAKDRFLEKGRKSDKVRKLKSSGEYLYYSNGAIAFTTNSSSAAQSINLSSGKGPMKSGNYEFYHSATDQGFGYTNNKNANNLMFFKLQ